MKILKKIGIGCLALIICFCSCFKFVNAETSNFTLQQNQEYYVYISENVDATKDVPLDVANGSRDTIIYFYLFNDEYYFDFELESGDFFTQIINYVTTENGYNVFSFIFYYPTEEFSFYDSNIAYFDNIENTFSVYDTIYNLIETYIFGGNIEVGSHQDLTATTLSSIICVLVFALPFLIIWKVIKVIMG